MDQLRPDYFKIPVVEKGIYRIPYDQLQKAGFPVQTSPAKIQLFKQGTEQAIYISGEQDGKLDTGDFIEFYGVRNDGSRDSSLYRDPKLQTNKYVSLFSDTTYYFLTFRVDNGSGKPHERCSCSLRLQACKPKRIISKKASSFLPPGIRWGQPIQSACDTSRG